MSSEGQCTAFYQSHSTILHNYNIYRCSWVCLFTSNDGDEQWREHRINKMQFNTDKAKTVFISQYRARLQERIYHRASWHSHDGSSSLYSSWTDSRVPVSKKRKKISSLIHLNINTLVASFDRYAELKGRWWTQTMRVKMSGSGFHSHVERKQFVLKLFSQTHLYSTTAIL